MHSKRMLFFVVGVRETGGCMFVAPWTSRSWWHDYYEKLVLTTKSSFGWGPLSSLYVEIEAKDLEGDAKRHCKVFVTISRAFTSPLFYVLLVLVFSRCSSRSLQDSYCHGCRVGCRSWWSDVFAMDRWHQCTRCAIIWSYLY